MNTSHAAIYARVSSDQQATAHTIASQVAALRARVATDGLALPERRQFLDEGYSGATLLRPALERLRDLIATGAIDRLSVHSPDRLARKYAYQVLLVDEFQRMGAEIIFLNRELGQSPEDDLLLQVQGMMAEYERAKILERHRRGKLPAARAGSPVWMSAATATTRPTRRDPRNPDVWNECDNANRDYSLAQFTNCRARPAAFQLARVAQPPDSTTIRSGTA
jgi:site-specific DNA recombinase